MHHQNQPIPGHLAGAEFFEKLRSTAPFPQGLDALSFCDAISQTIATSLAEGRPVDVPFLGVFSDAISGRISFTPSPAFKARLKAV